MREIYSTISVQESRFIFRDNLKDDKNHPPPRHETRKSCITDIQVIHCISQVFKKTMFVLMENYERDSSVNGEPGVGGYTDKADRGNKH